MSVRKGFLMAVALVIGLGPVACKSVKPWERETLARPEMAWDADAQEAQRLAHIHWSKEAAMPGGSTGGGGCGCN